MILGIESSCDESALALLDRDVGLRGEWISSQIALHADYGGVVPDLASREHLNNFGPMLEEAGRSFDLRQVAEIVVTVGPGLAGCLAMGMAAANALGVAWKVPVYGANHLRAHAHSVFVAEYERAPVTFDERLPSLLPHLSLIVSGGNTLLVRIEKDRSLRLLGGTIDDAAGEALDKGAKLMDLGYPGGPKLENVGRAGNPQAFDFPRALMNKPNLDFSFSGLKTSLRYTLDRYEGAEILERMPDLCASYQWAVVDALIRKADKALQGGGFKSIGLCGGVSNNQLLRDKFESLAERRGQKALLAQRKHTGDNAGMIAFSHVFEKGDTVPEQLLISPSLGIETRV